MRPWALWMIRRRMAWLLKTLVVATYPLHLLAYCGDALDDVLSTVRNIDMEAKKCIQH